MKYEKPQVISHNAATAANPYETLVNQILTTLAYEADELSHLQPTAPRLCPS